MMEQEKMRVSLAELLPVMEEQLAAGKEGQACCLCCGRVWIQLF